jgi:methionyl-tRNA formyltransferase
MHAVMSREQQYLLATVKAWNIEAFERHRESLVGDWQLLTSPDDFTIENLRRLNPRYIFMPHWSWRVPDVIHEEFECVSFHMTDLPYGRGGSPLQNLVVRGHSETKISALRMVHELDAGPIYLKQPLSLAGSAQQIFERSTTVIFEMINHIVKTQPIPHPQLGVPTEFLRRQPEESRMADKTTPQAVYDFIRMLDADTYPRAFLDLGQFRMHFSDAELIGDRVISKVSIAVRKDTP